MAATSADASVPAIRVRGLRKAFGSKVAVAGVDLDVPSGSFYGMRKKIGLAAALLHNPRVLLLDEPFEGVDPISAHTIREVLSRYTESGATVVFSSHVMELVEHLCDTVAIVDDGAVRTQGTLGEVRGDTSLEDAFLRIVGARSGLSGTAAGEGLSWLGASSD